MARWADLAPWRGPTVNSGDGDSNFGEAADRLTEVRGLIVHIAEGFFEGTISWQKNPDANVSSHWVGGRAGGRAQMVDTDDRAWTQSSANPFWLSIEEEGFTLGHSLHRPGWERLTAEQAEFTAQLFARICTTYDVPLQLATSPWDKGLAYHSLGAEHGVNWGHSDCPGEPVKAQLPAILARAIEIVNGDDMSINDNIPLPAQDFPELLGQTGAPLGGTVGYVLGLGRKAERQLTELQADVAVLKSRPPVALSEQDKADIIAGLAKELGPVIAGLRAGVEADTRDAVADGLEGGGAAVRADAG